MHKRQGGDIPLWNEGLALPIGLLSVARSSNIYHRGILRTCLPFVFVGRYAGVPVLGSAYGCNDNDLFWGTASKSAWGENRWGDAAATRDNPTRNSAGDAISAHGMRLQRPTSLSASSSSPVSAPHVSQPRSTPAMPTHTVSSREQSGATASDAEVSELAPALDLLKETASDAISAAEVGRCNAGGPAAASVSSKEARESESSWSSLPFPAERKEQASSPFDAGALQSTRQATSTSESTQSIVRRTETLVVPTSATPLVAPRVKPLADTATALPCASSAEVHPKTADAGNTAPGTLTRWPVAESAGAPLAPAERAERLQPPTGTDMRQDPRQAASTSASTHSIVRRAEALVAAASMAQSADTAQPSSLAAGSLQSAGGATFAGVHTEATNTATGALTSSLGQLMTAGPGGAATSPRSAAKLPPEPDISARVLVVGDDIDRPSTSMSTPANPKARAATSRTPEPTIQPLVEQTTFLACPPNGTFVSEATAGAEIRETASPKAHAPSARAQSVSATAGRANSDTRAHEGSAACAQATAQIPLDGQTMGRLQSTPIQPWLEERTVMHGLATVADTVCALVQREVKAALERSPTERPAPASKETLPTPSPAASTDALGCDNTVRELMRRMSDLAREDRFRRGILG